MKLTKHMYAIKDKVKKMTKIKAIWSNVLPKVSSLGFFPIGLTKEMYERADVQYKESATFVLKGVTNNDMYSFNYNPLLFKNANKYRDFYNLDNWVGQKKIEYAIMDANKQKCKLLQAKIDALTSQVDTLEPSNKILTIVTKRLIKKNLHLTSEQEKLRLLPDKFSVLETDYKASISKIAELESEIAELKEKTIKPTGTVNFHPASAASHPNPVGGGAASHSHFVGGAGARPHLSGCTTIEDTAFSTDNSLAHAAFMGIKAGAKKFKISEEVFSSIVDASLKIYHQVQQQHNSVENKQIMISNIASKMVNEIHIAWNTKKHWGKKHVTNKEEFWRTMSQYVGDFAKDPGEDNAYNTLTEIEIAHLEELISNIINGC